jgi:hypothetical protein
MGGAVARFIPQGIESRIAGRRKKHVIGLPAPARGDTSVHFEDLPALIISLRRRMSSSNRRPRSAEDSSTGGIVLL